MLNIVDAVETCKKPTTLAKSELATFISLTAFDSIAAHEFVGDIPFASLVRSFSRNQRKAMVCDLPLPDWTYDGGGRIEGGVASYRKRVLG